MKKVLFTLNINNYAPEITALTYPLMRRYAEKIRADFVVIGERKFPNWPIDYEKMQIYELGRGNDWNLFIDSDVLIYPDFFDLTNHIPKSVVLHAAIDMASIRWVYDDYFLRDGRNIGSASWFCLASNWCMDFWRPLDDLTLEEASARIYPSVVELKSNGGAAKREHLIADYAFSRNIARFGLQFLTSKDLLNKLRPGIEYLWHHYLLTNEEKAAAMRKVLSEWQVPGIEIPRDTQEEETQQLIAAATRSLRGRLPSEDAQAEAFVRHHS